MRKKYKASVSLILTLLISIFSNFMVAVGEPSGAPQGSAVNLVLDTESYDEILPKNFRKSTDLSILKENKTINKKGLDKLNISGSQQFTGHNLSQLVEAIGTRLPVTVVDLRQESHGFINGYAVSWADAKNNANVGLTREQVLIDEVNKLKSIKLNEPLTFYNHPKKSIIPTKVENEEELVGGYSLCYNRVTVRDGGIPTEDMVDYFVESVKALPKEQWLHFHCKEGIGRTSTFMIMYDMMRNYKVASAEEIIARQLALANYKEETVKSFYNNERIGFLNSFYAYCKANGEEFKKTYSQWKKESAASITDVLSLSTTYQKNIVSTTAANYIKNPVAATTLYVVSQDTLSKSERTMVASLQGLVNSHCSSQIYTLSSSQPDYKTWLEDLKNKYKVSYEMLTDPWELLSIYREYIDGYILYSSKNPKDPSINNACSLAGLKKALVVDESIQAKVKQKGITKVLGDCRNTGEAWAFNNLWNKGLNHSMVIQLSPEKSAPLRDYAIMTKSLIFFEESKDTAVLREKVFSSMEGNPICLGWGPDEFKNVSAASRQGVSIVAADWSYNLSVLSAFSPVAAVKSPRATIPKEEQVHYVTFLMSDGDNQQWNLGSNYSSPKWFGYSNRDKLSLGWSMSPSLYYLAPTVFNKYYRSLRGEEVYNNFIVSPSGNGYMFPSKLEKNMLDSYLEELDSYMEKVDQRYVSIIDDGALKDAELWNKFLSKKNIDGLIYLDYSRQDKYKGEMLWVNNKPVVSCRDLLWKNLEEEDELVKNINHRVSSGQVNINTPEAYSFVYVHVWSKTTENVQQVVDRLRQNPKVRVVPPETFMELIKANVKPKPLSKASAWPASIVFAPEIQVLFLLSSYSYLKVKAIWR